VQTCDAGCSRDAAKPEDGHPAHVGSQPQPPGDAGIERRGRHPGHRGCDDQVDVPRAKPCLVERAGDGRASEVDGMVDEEIVRLAEVGQGCISLRRQHEVASVDLCAGMQFSEDVLVPAEGGMPDEGLGDFALRVAVLWQGAMHPGDYGPGVHYLDTRSDAGRFTASYSS